MNFGGIMLSQLLPTEVSALLKRLESCGFRPYLVGGCVRDFLMGLCPHDYDIASSATPDQVIKLFSDLRVVPTGIKHGTVTVINGGISVEITTFRREGGYKDHRHPDSVCFTDDPLYDAARRDFTVNAMYYSLAEGVLDYYGGRSDLAARILRAVGDPRTRFEEDALRILRALRFAARFGFAIEANTAEAMEEKAHLLKHIAAERVLAELKQVFLGNHIDEIMKSHSCVVHALFGERSVPETGAYPSAYRLPIFLAYCGGNVQCAKDLCKRLKADKATAKSVNAAASALFGCGFESKACLARAVGLYGYENTEMMCTIYERQGAPLPFDWHTHLALMRDGVLPASLRELALKGDELASLGEIKGPRLGRLLDRLFELVHNGGTNEKGFLLEQAKILIDGGL